MAKTRFLHSCTKIIMQNNWLGSRAERIQLSTFARAVCVCVQFSSRWRSSNSRRGHNDNNAGRSPTKKFHPSSAKRKCSHGFYGSSKPFFFLFIFNVCVCAENGFDNPIVADRFCNCTDFINDRNRLVLACAFFCANNSFTQTKLQTTGDLAQQPVLSLSLWLIRNCLIIITVAAYTQTLWLQDKKKR